MVPDLPRCVIFIAEGTLCLIPASFSTEASRTSSTHFPFLHFCGCYAAAENS